MTTARAAALSPQEHGGLCFEIHPRRAVHHNVAKPFKVPRLTFPLIVSGRIREHDVKPDEACSQVRRADRPTSTRVSLLRHEAGGAEPSSLRRRRRMCSLSCVKNLARSERAAAVNRFLDTITRVMSRNAVLKTPRKLQTPRRGPAASLRYRSSVRVEATLASSTSTVVNFSFCIFCFVSKHWPIR